MGLFDHLTAQLILAFRIKLNLFFCFFLEIPARSREPPSMALSPSSPPCLRSLQPSPPLFPRQSGFLVPNVQYLAFGSFRRHELLRPNALREWREYEDAVKRKDLAGALRFLKSIENDENLDEAIESNVAAPITTKLNVLGALELERDWQVLDACLNADDMRLVGSAFRFLKERGLLANFGKFSSIGTLFSIFCISIVN